MGGGKCQLCMKESAAIERTWRGQSRVIRYGGRDEDRRLSMAVAENSRDRR